MLEVTPFHPSVSDWFANTFAEPTEVQLAAWPVIAAGDHALITAPTGSGKTLTAFMWALSRFASDWEPGTGKTRVLYLSPLKALNNDIRRNLLEPLHALKAEYGYPGVSVQTRSGDTSSSDRQKMLRRPPDILITTPESLNLLLTTRKGRMALSFVETVILDEIHSIVDNRRGVQLMANLERLADLSDEFQRIALSATVSPLEDVATYVAGRTPDGDVRPVEVVNVAGQKEIEFSVQFPEAARVAAENGDKIWSSFADSFRDTIAENEATLFFTNSRRLAEKMTLRINEGTQDPVAYAHHGSLAREIRTEVEHRLKAGELKAIVATNSLEMGIDVGHLDEVVMVQSPPSVASALQRIGRAGHRVGEVSVGTLYPTHAHDFLEAAVLAEAIENRDIEPLQPMTGPLDVLAQIIISTCATDPWSVDDVYQLVKRSRPYENLAREHFDLVIDMLAGRYAGTRIRELKARITYDRINNTIQASRGALLALYSSGGTIPDRGYFKMRHIDSGAVLGELDEEFVWEATTGDRFTLGTQHWQIHRITHNDVVVRQAKPGSSAPPFWRSESFNRSYHFSERINQYLEMADHQLEDADHQAFADKLEDGAGFAPAAAVELAEYLTRQKEHTGAALPHRHHLVLELIKAGPAGYRGPDDPRQLVIHTLWGGKLNHPMALALRAAWLEATGSKLDIHADNNAIVLQVKADPDPHEIMTMVTPDRLLDLLRKSLEQSGFFGARFRECAGRSLLLNKQKFNQRLPLWMSRVQAKKLMTQVKKLSDFPVMLETWRTCLDDEFDIPALQARLEEIADGTIQWSYVTTTTPSPFAHNLTFDQVNRYMYADDTPENDAASLLNTSLITEAVQNEALRPAIDLAVVDEFERKRQRRIPEYEPTSPEEWGEWLKERILIPDYEIPHGVSLPRETHTIEIDGRVWLTHLEIAHTLYNTGFVPGSPPEGLPEVADPRDAWQLAREVLSFYGPRTAGQIELLLPSIPEDLMEADEDFIQGQLVTGTQEVHFCDAENFEILLRFARAARRSSIEPQAQSGLPGFWANYQGFGHRDTSQQELAAMEALRGYPASVRTWLLDLLPARIPGYTPSRLAPALEKLGMGWRGTGKENITIAYPEELELLPSTTDPPPFAAAFSDPLARYEYRQIADTVGCPLGELNDPWWEAVWAGQISSDGVAALEQGLSQNFQLSSDTNVSSRRRLRRPPRSWPGTWYLTRSVVTDDPITELETDKERVRLLLDRYGFVNRDIVNREALPVPGGAWRWQQAFRAIRIMELAGEVITGLFFEGLSTPQFASPQAVSVLANRSDPPGHFWISATDPVSPCGLSLEWDTLPQRRPTNYLSFHKGELALIVESGGKHLQFEIAADHDAIEEILGPLHHLVEGLRTHVRIETINGEESRSGPYLAVLERVFKVAKDHKSITLEPSF